MKHYLDFIKASQRFYRGYIGKLWMSFRGISGLERVAHKFKLSGTMSSEEMIHALEVLRAYNHADGGAGTKAEVSRLLERQAVLSCYQALVRLGDLSRYRETELASKDRNWGPAIGYYELACSIFPASGVAHNQLAVVALADGNHLRATYHLYRALAVDDPHPSSMGNLEIVFKKVVNAWTKGNLIPKGPASENRSAKVLAAWFVLLHARCYKGEAFAGHDELESEVLCQLASSVRSQLPDATLLRIVLINISAEYLAGVKVQGEYYSRGIHCS